VTGVDAERGAHHTTRVPTARATPPARWTQRVTRESDALDLEPGVFLLPTARAIAESLRRSAERSTRRKASPFRSAMSMLVFYVNRAGKNLDPERRAVLEQAKDELRALYGRPRRAARRSTRARPGPPSPRARRRSRAAGAPAG
jgi:hypothetical protein